jgi:hypothetical protein
MSMKQFFEFNLASADDAVRLGLPRGQQSIKLSLAPADVTTAEEIDTYLPGYMPFGGFRADEIAPPEPLFAKETDLFRMFGLNNVFRRLHVQTSRTAPVGEVDPETTLGTYRALPFALGSFIPAETEDQSNYDLRKAAARRIKDALTLDREARLWSVLTTPGNWNTNNRTVLTGGFQWNGGASSDPILDLQTMIEKSAQVITGIYMSLKAGHAFLRHDKVRDHMRQMLGDSAPTPQLVGGAGVQGTNLVDFVIPGLPPIKIAGAKVLNEATGGLDSMIGDGNVVGISNAPAGGAQYDAIQTVKTFRYKQPSGTGWVTREFQVDQRGLNGGTMMVSGFSEDIKMVSNVSGFLIGSAVV